MYYKKKLCKDYIFYKKICEMCILSYMKWNCKKIKIYIGTKTNFGENFLFIKFFILLFYKYICKMFEFVEYKVYKKKSDGRTHRNTYIHTHIL